jgi:DNA mismatch endonuclease (patch repair protein)
MADIVSKEVRSRMMSGIRSHNTKPERIVRSGLHRLGYRFGLHNRRIPGTPDLVMPKHNAVLFIHGCFWHGHSCALFKMPATRTDFWNEKISRNRKNDKVKQLMLAEKSWRIAIIWECAIRGKDEKSLGRVYNSIDRWLRSSRKFLELPM